MDLLAMLFVAVGFVAILIHLFRRVFRRGRVWIARMDTDYVEEMREATGATTKEEVLSRALQVYFILILRMQDGKTLHLKDRSGRMQELRLSGLSGADTPSGNPDSKSSRHLSLVK